MMGGEGMRSIGLDRGVGVVSRLVAPDLRLYNNNNRLFPKV